MKLERRGSRITSDAGFLAGAEADSRCLKMRLIYKPFVDNDEILWEYKRWAGNTPICRSD